MAGRALHVVLLESSQFLMQQVIRKWISCSSTVTGYEEWKSRAVAARGRCRGLSALANALGAQPGLVVGMGGISLAQFLEQPALTWLAA